MMVDSGWSVKHDHLRTQSVISLMTAQDTALQTVLKTAQRSDKWRIDDLSTRLVTGDESSW